MFLVASLGALAAGCAGPSVMAPAGPIAGQERVILLNALAVMLAIVVPTILATLAFAWWFRASNTRATYRPTWAYSGAIELVVWSIPTMVILFLGGLIWMGSHDLDPARPIASRTPATEVQVVSLDWKWLFIYPQQGVASVNRLVVPAGTPVHFTLTSSSVMNVFFVPQLGSEIYTMNGMATQLNLKADRPGVFYGQSAHFSGDGFADMNFQVHAVPEDAFVRWVAATKTSGGALDRGAYAQLARQSQAVRPFTYRAVEPALFQAIVNRQAAPGPGPDTGNDGASHSPAGQSPRAER